MGIAKRRERYKHGALQPAFSFEDDAADPSNDTAARRAFMEGLSLPPSTIREVPSGRSAPTLSSNVELMSNSILSGIDARMPKWCSVTPSGAEDAATAAPVEAPSLVIDTHAATRHSVCPDTQFAQSTVPPSSRDASAAS